MGKIFTNKKIWKMLVVAILVIMVVQVLVPTTVVFADKEPSDAAQTGDNLLWAGILMRPILSFLVTIGDGIIGVFHSYIMGQSSSLISVFMGDNLDILWAILGAITIAIGIAVMAALLITGVGELIAPFIGATVPKYGILLVSIGIGSIAGFAMYSEQIPQTLYLPVYSYSAEEIFKDNILLFNVNFFDTESKQIWVNYNKVTRGVEKNIESGYNGGGGHLEENREPQDPMKIKDYEKFLAEQNQKNTEDNQATKESNNTSIYYEVNYYYYYKDGDSKNNSEDNIIKTSPQDSAQDLRNVIARWYIIIRNICIVGMLSVLVYIGIRMILTTVANDKAKYMEMLKDWVVGLCLLFIIHYIMAFSVTLVGKINDVVKTAVNQNAYMGKISDTNSEKLKEAATKLGMSEYYNESTKELCYPTNLLGYLRLEIQKKDTEQTGEYIGLSICFLILVIFTVWFTFTYLKRLLYMAFLTIIAPMVALTYPIDKINDGQAQGFNMWLKEYIFNLLIQPMHLLLYFILVTSAFDLAGKNVIYSLVALGFMLPAEKLLRSMFGFEKAKTPPLLGGPAGAALMMQGINTLSSIARGGGKGKKASDGIGGGSDSDDKSNIFTVDDTIGKLAGNIADTETEGPFDGEKEKKLSLPGTSSKPKLEDDDKSKSPTASTPNLDGNWQNTRKNPIWNNRSAVDRTNQKLKNAKQRKIRGYAKKFISPYARGGRASLAAGKVILRNAPKNIGRATWRAAKGITAGVATGALTAGIGAAATIASGDPKNMLTAMGTTAGITGAIGSRAANFDLKDSVTSHLSQETKDAFNEEWNRDEYKQQDREEAYAKAVNNLINRRKAERVLGSEAAADEFMSGNMREWMQSGQTDFNEMLAQQKLVKEEDVRPDYAQAAMQVYKDFGKKDPERMGAKDKENLDKTLFGGYKSRLGDEGTARDKTDTTIGHLHSIDKYMRGI